MIRRLDDNATASIAPMPASDAHPSADVLPAGCPTLAAWPSDYVLCDEGRLWIRRDYVAVFEQLGWTTLRAILETQRCHVVRRVGQRDNCRLLLPAPQTARPDNPSDMSDSSPAPIAAYLKRHQGSYFSAWLASKLTGQPWNLPGIDEAEAVGACQRAGVATMNVIAAGQQFGPKPWQGESFFLSEGIDGGTPADDFWKLRFPDEPKEPSGHQSDQAEQDEHTRAVDRAERRRVLLAIAETARRLHAARLFHRDLYWCHFFVREPGKGEFAAHLIDLQRIHHTRWDAWRWQLKDLAQFVYSAPPGSLDGEGGKRWFARYFGYPDNQTSLRVHHRIAAWGVRVRAAFYRWKEGAP